MYEFVVFRFTNHTDGTTGNIVHPFMTEAEAIKDFFKEAGKAVDSTHLTDSVSLLTKEGFEVRHECFKHEAQPVVEEVEPTEGE